MSTPIERLARILDDGYRFTAGAPGQVSIDITPDVVAAIAGIQTDREGFESGRNLLEPGDHGRDVPTRVQIP